MRDWRDLRDQGDRGEGQRIEEETKRDSGGLWRLERPRRQWEVYKAGRRRLRETVRD